MFLGEGAATGCIRLRTRLQLWSIFLPWRYVLETLGADFPDEMKFPRTGTAVLLSGQPLSRTQINLYRIE